MFISADFNVTNLMKILQPLAQMWFRIGVQLGISVSQLKCIEIEHPRDPERGLGEVIEFWLNGKADEPASLKSIVAALKSSSVKEPHLAKRLSDEFQKSEGKTVKA